MKKFTKSIAKLLCLLTGVTAIAAPLSGCGNEIKALVLASDALDGLFNPFFYTSGPDGEIVGQTQIGMLSGDKTGQPLASWNEPCVAFDYSVVKSGDKSEVQGNNYGNYKTDYYFALKDNIRFSDGVYLTKDDVLFNIYMYLDPAYTGSNTMYSVKIKGLTQYRTQTPNIDSAAGAADKFEGLVEDRLLAIESWIDSDNVWGDAGFAQFECYENEKTLESDIRQIQEYYRQGLEETWTSVISADIEKEYEKYKKADGSLVISEPWELFLYANGMLTFKEHRNTATGKIDYYEPYEHEFTGKVPSKKKDRAGDKFKKQLIDAAYDKVFYGLENATRKQDKTNLLNAMESYPANVYFYDYLLADVKHRQFQGNMQVDNVSGIEIMNGKQASIPYRVDEKNNESEIKYRTLCDATGNPKSYYVLHITIDGVDPKAIQNFSFTVAPGHYYSDKDVWDKAVNDNDADNKNFGVVFSDPSFMSRVRQKQLPMGAGAYVAATEDGSKAKTKGQFMGSNNLVCFVANDKFMLGTPKTKHLRYKVISSSQLYNAVKRGEVDYASPSMKRDDINLLSGDDAKKLNFESADNLGYGYIGISARYIPNIYIRKGIMTVLNSKTIIDTYYGTAGASVIVRPMSKTLEDFYTWKDEDVYYDFDDSGDEAVKWFRKGGCSPDKDGNFFDENGKRMKYTFTIAGDSDDHPAASMLQQAADILNRKGLDITVTHDSMALSKLSSGLLTVWAAAWSSSSDPDMYQVYHKDSQATSTTAWGYKYLLSSGYTGLKVNPDGYDQVQMIKDLSDKIDDGRETDVVDDRVEIYNDAMDMLMDLAVEYPTYQRKVYYIWRKGVFNETTIKRGSGEVTTYQSPLSRIWEVEIKK